MLSSKPWFGTPSTDLRKRYWDAKETGIGGGHPKYLTTTFKHGAVDFKRLVGHAA
jgi:hypothetical protein